VAEKKVNLTGGQVQEILDTLLYGALKPIILYTNLFDSQLIYLLSMMTQNKKRKLCSLERSEAISKVCTILASLDKEDKFKMITSLGIERDIVHGFLRKFHSDYASSFDEVYSKLLVSLDKKSECEVYTRRLSAFLLVAKCESRSKYFLTIQRSRDYLNVYFSYFGKLTEDYVKLCMQQAGVHVKSNPNRQFDLYDTRQKFLSNVVVALNKYDSSRGALTSYIKWWILNARTCSGSDHEYGIAYSLPQQQQKKKATKEDNTANNFSVSLDAPAASAEGEMESLHSKIPSPENLFSMLASQESADSIAGIIKAVDINSFVRLSLDVPEPFSIKDLRKMITHMEQHGLHKNVNKIRKQIKHIKRNKK